ncbi:MAG: porin [Massilia sp.]
MKHLRQHGSMAMPLLALACYANGVQAQTNVALYGIVDAAVAHMNNADNAGHGVTRVPSLTGSVPSRIGLRGSEDLGNGMAVVFTLENGFNPDTGTQGQGGRLFGRQAWVGLRGKWGLVQIGRLPNMSFHALAKSDVMGPSLFSINSIDLYFPNARSDNAVGYLGNFGGITLGATYSLGRDALATGGPAATGCGGETPGNARACRQYTWLLGYESDRYGVNASYDKLFGNAGAANGLTSSANFDRRITMNGYVMLGAGKVGAGVIARKTFAATGTMDSNLYYLGASYPLTASMVVDAQIARKDIKRSGDDTNMAVARLTYSLSKRSAVYAGAGRMDNKGMAAVSLDAGGTVGAGKAQSGVMAGIRHTF